MAPRGTVPAHGRQSLDDLGGGPPKPQESLSETMHGKKEVHHREGRVVRVERYSHLEQENRPCIGNSAVSAPAYVAARFSATLRTPLKPRRQNVSPNPLPALSPPPRSNA